MKRVLLLKGLPSGFLCPPRFLPVEIPVGCDFYRAAAAYNSLSKLYDLKLSENRLGESDSPWRFPKR
jgi:hypothetical protein